MVDRTVVPNTQHLNVGCASMCRSRISVYMVATMKSRAPRNFGAAGNCGNSRAYGAMPSPTALNVTIHWSRPSKAFSSALMSALGSTRNCAVHSMN